MALDLSSYPKQPRTVIKALESLGVEAGWELVRGEGYYYFVSPPNYPIMRESMVYTTRISDLTLGQWIEEFKGLAMRGPDLSAPKADAEPKNPLKITTCEGHTTITLGRKS